MSANFKEYEAAAGEPAEARKLTDGFPLLIDALQANGLNTIYGVPGIPITDFSRLAQASGMRVISFRHEQHAGNAAAISRIPDTEAGLVSDRIGTGFSQRAHSTCQCYNQLLSDDSDQWLLGTGGCGSTAG